MSIEITFESLQQDVSAEFEPTSDMDMTFESVIGGGGIIPTGEIEISENGNYNVSQYATAEVNVPNSYSASDEGKVVDDGELVTQGSQTYTANGTYDTTKIKSVTVDVPGSTPTGTKNISISANGTTTEDVADYANAQITVAVPVPVLDTLTATDNGTYTPTTGHAYSSVVVAIPSASGVSF